ncbi:MAG TPA: LLM class flavin-dependent oxidoreductase [Ktedonobacterales bacterium]
MRFGVNVPNFGSMGDARLLSDLAQEAEQCGWDGFFLWDHIGADWGPDNPFADPWLALTAMAMTTSRLTLGLAVTPLPRRRPWKVAREAVTLGDARSSLWRTVDPRRRHRQRQRAGV